MESTIIPCWQPVHLDISLGAGIIGSNGAGKSTLFRMLMGQEQPDSGTVTLGETVVPMYVDQSRGSLGDGSR